MAADAVDHRVEDGAKGDGVAAGLRHQDAALDDAALLDVRAETITLAKSHGRAAVLVFYRGAWCPYCNVILQIYQAQLVPALADLGVGLIAISRSRTERCRCGGQ